MAIFVHFDLLLGFLDIRRFLLFIDIVVLSYILCNTTLLEDIQRIFTTFFIYSWCIFNALPLNIRLYILFRVYLMIYSLDIEFFVLKVSSTPWDFATILNPEPGSSGKGSQPPTPGGNNLPGGSNLPPSDSIGQASVPNPTINGIIEKVRLQFDEGTSKSIYSNKWENKSALLNDGEKQLLLTKLSALHQDYIKPYALYERDVFVGRRGHKEWRVVYTTIAFPALNNLTPEAKPTLKFVDFLMKINNT
jgi:hypothetical protein